jgi:hypothetical protein
MTTELTTISDVILSQLRSEAAPAGDDATVALCERLIDAPAPGYGPGAPSYGRDLALAARIISEGQG